MPFLLGYGYICEVCSKIFGLKLYLLRQKGKMNDTFISVRVVCLAFNALI